MQLKRKEIEGEKALRRSNKYCFHSILPCRDMRWVRGIFKMIVKYHPTKKPQAENVKHSYITEPNSIIRFDHAEYHDKIASIGACLEDKEEILMVIQNNSNNPSRFSIIHLHPSVEPTQIMGLVNAELNWVREKYNESKKRFDVVCNKPCFTFILREDNEFYRKLFSTFSAEENKANIRYQPPIQVKTGCVHYDSASKKFLKDKLPFRAKNVPYNYSVDQMDRMLLRRKAFFAEAVERVTDDDCFSDNEYSKKITNFVTDARHAQVKVLMDPDEGLILSESGFLNKMSEKLAVAFAFMLQLTPENREAEDINLLVFMMKFAYQRAMEGRFMVDKEREQELERKMIDWYGKNLDFSNNDCNAAFISVHDQFERDSDKYPKTDLVFFRMQDHATCYGDIIIKNQEVFFEHMRLALHYIDKFPHYVPDNLLEENLRIVGKGNLQVFQDKWSDLRFFWDNGKRDIDNLLSKVETNKSSAYDRALSTLEQYHQFTEENEQYKKSRRGKCMNKMKTCGGTTLEKIKPYAQKIAPIVMPLAPILRYGPGGVFMLYMLYTGVVTPIAGLGSVVIEGGKSLLGYSSPSI